MRLAPFFCFSKALVVLVGPYCQYIKIYILYVNIYVTVHDNLVHISYTCDHHEAFFR